MTWSGRWHGSRRAHWQRRTATNAAIYYEDTSKRKVLALITVLRGLQSVQVSTLLQIYRGVSLPEILA